MADPSNGASQNSLLPHSSLEKGTPTTNGSGPSTSSITVILPSQSITLRIPVPPTATVHDLKNYIYDRCPGRPSQSGQRLIWRGRFLKDDEVVGDVVKNGSDDQPVYLAVHPQSWTESKPGLTNAEEPTSVQLPAPTLPRLSPLPSPLAPVSLDLLPSRNATTPSLDIPDLSITASVVNIPQQFVIHQHSNAIRLLAGEPLKPWLGPGEFKAAKSIARRVLVSQKQGWPPKDVFDQDLFVRAQKEPVSFSNGAYYNYTVVNGLPYLSLLNPYSSPTPLQQVAIDTLTYTYPILPHLHALQPSHHVSSSPSPTTAEALLRLAAARRPADIPPSPIVSILRRAISPLVFVVRNPTRLLLPISLIVFRAAFIIYIFGWTPSQSFSWFSIVLAWMFWEIWTIYKVEIARQQPPRVVNPQPAANAPPAANGPAAQPAAQQEQREANGAANPVPENQQQNQNPGGDAPGPVAPPAAGPAPAPVVQPIANGQLASILGYLSAYHLQWEREQLGIDPPAPTGSSDETPVQGPEVVPAHLLREPTRLERIKVALILFFYSMFPEVWARRVDALRLREGQIREVYGRDWNEVPTDDPEQKEQNDRIRRFAERRQALTGWRRDYVRRVLSGAGQDVDL